jgi:hypothetical protein
MASASWAVMAAGCPVRLALDTASGPVSVRISRTTRLEGMRTATVPFVSPRSQFSDDRAGRMTVRPPGQKASTSERTSSGTASASASSVGIPGMSTGGGDWRPRPFAARSRATALGWKASAATPYTVSVGTTTSSPLPIADRASRMPVSSSVGIEQS